MFPFGSKIAPSLASFERIGISNTPWWCSGLITPVIFKKQIMTVIQPAKQGRHTAALTKYNGNLCFKVKWISGWSVTGLIEILPLNSLRTLLKTAS